jgi:mycothiol S-conjugate amidase
VPVEVSGEPLIRLIRDFRPHVITTYDENGGYPHPDHIQTHIITMYAADAAADPDSHPDAGVPWQTHKVYYQLGFHKQRLIALHEAALEENGTSPFAEWLEEWEDHPEDEGRLTTQVECAEFFEIRERALKAHATQVDPDGDWFGISLQTQQRVWPTEDYQLVRTYVQAPVNEHGIETDLFAGIRVLAEGAA